MKRHLTFLALSLGLFLLLYTVGRLRANGGEPLLLQSDSPVLGIDYMLPADLRDTIPREDMASWLEEQGLPLPTGSSAAYQAQLIYIAAPAAYHKTWEAWLDEQAVGEWRTANREILNLAWQVNGRIYGFLSWENEPDGKIYRESGQPVQYSMLFFHYYGDADYYFSSAVLHIASRLIWYYGPAWVGVLIITQLPLTFFYILRKPILRALTFGRRRTPIATDS